MLGVVPISERKRRNKMLRILSAKKLRAFYEKQKGKTGVALMEHENRDGWMFGFTDNYVKVKLPFDEAMSNNLVAVKIGEPDETGCVGAERLIELQD
jgi:threonylcarbamoyladenosine tRNA methylthiotransferase MtaB